MTHQHVAVWIDHQEAKLFHVLPDGFDVTKIEAPYHHFARKALEQGRHAGSEDFYHQVAAALADATEILIVGPSSAKLDLFRHIHRHDHTLEAKIVGVETLDHPTEGRLVAYVRHYFEVNDRKRAVAHT